MSSASTASVPQLPRPEHPNPIFQRPHWISLNGPWEFAFDPHNQGEHARWWRHPSSVSFERQITVPFPWESALSGICSPSYRGAAWYRRTISIPATWHERHLHPHIIFGAVDWEARLWVNGLLAGEHQGGYSTFDFDLHRFCQNDAPITLTLRAYDANDAATLNGKQVPHWYTSTSGIWQPVWLEARPASYITSLRLQPSLAQSQILATTSLFITDAGTFTLSLQSPDHAFSPIHQSLQLGIGETTVTLTIPIAHPHPWSPDAPFLYHVTATLNSNHSEPDHVETYTGLRDVSTGHWDNRPYQYVFLNGEPIYLRGALDQAFHPDGLYAYPSDDVIRNDIETAKQAGLNFLRCHIKINDPRYYYWADRLGLLLMQDIPNPSIWSPASRHAWEQCFRHALERDGNHPSIFSWVLFNETWGLTEHHTSESWQWLASWVDRAHRLDPTRLIEDNSPCNYDHVRTDLNTWHFYIHDWQRARQHVEHVVQQTYPGSTFNYVSDLSRSSDAVQYRQGNEPLLNSEYGGISAHMGDRDISQSLRYLTTDLRRHDRICGYIYTELTDVEWEHNGLCEYDRSPKTFGYDHFVSGMNLPDILGADVIGWDLPPIQTLPPGAALSASLFVSHWSYRDLAHCRIHWSLEHTDRFGGHFLVRDGFLTPAIQRYTVTTLDPLILSLPHEPGLTTLILRLLAHDGAVVARNYVNIELWESPSPRLERCPSGWVSRVSPNAFLASSWPTGRGPSLRGHRLAVSGHARINYLFPWPTDLSLHQVSGLRLLLELATAASHHRSTPWGGKQPGIPQTESHRQQPGDIAIELAGLPISTIHVPDDPNDACGILTFHQSDGEHSSYGFLFTISIPNEQLATLLSYARDHSALPLTLAVPSTSPARGITIYGERAGAYPIDLTLFIDTAL